MNDIELASKQKDNVSSSHWLEKVQRRDLSAYYANLRHYLRAVGGANPSLHQATQRFSMSKRGVHTMTVSSCATHGTA